MALYFMVIAAIGAVVSAAPRTPQSLYPQHQTEQLQQAPPSGYYLNSPELAAYYNDALNKQASASSSSNASPARLETLEPDSEVELIPGAQTPQQPPMQNPVAPNIPGLLPGQRVFIVHMPIPGYRPGTIGGYQPVYVVAADPQANAGYTPNGYQNTYLVDQSGQVVSPVLGYPQAVAGAASHHPGLLLRGSVNVNRPLYNIYQDPAVQYHPVGAVQGVEGHHGAVRLAQIVGLQVQPAYPVEPKPAAVGRPSDSQQANQESSQKAFSDDTQQKSTTASQNVQTRKS